MRTGKSHWEVSEPRQVKQSEQGHISQTEASHAGQDRGIEGDRRTLQGWGSHSGQKSLHCMVGSRVMGRGAGTCGRN